MSDEPIVNNGPSLFPRKRILLGCLPSPLHVPGLPIQFSNFFPGPLQLNGLAELYLMWDLLALGAPKSHG